MSCSQKSNFLEFITIIIIIIIIIIITIIIVITVTSAFVLFFFLLLCLKYSPSDRACSFSHPTSFSGSFISPPQRERAKKDPGSGWSRVSQKVGGDKKTKGGGEGS